MRKRRYTSQQGIRILTFMGLVILLLAIISLNSGSIPLSPSEVMQVLLGQGTTKQNLLIFEIRLPRIVLAILVGLGMGVSGSIMQSLLRNDMASPGILGINSGSGLFVLLFVVFFSANGLAADIILPILSFVGGMTAAGLIFLLSYRQGKDISPTGLILTGIALSSGYDALSTLLTLTLNEKYLEFALRWSAGSLWGDEWRYLAILTPWIVLLSGYVFYKSQMLNVLNLGNETATGLGVPVKQEFFRLATAAVALSSGSVALGGNFFFVGMISPHLARKLVGPNHKLLLPAAGLTGGIIVLLADIVTRIGSFGADIPTGITITILSSPYFLYLLAKAD